MRRFPAAFRAELRVTGDSPWPLSRLLQPWQQRDFAALDLAWRRLAGQPVAGGVRRAYLERPRGHAKTSDMAVQLLWILLFAPQAVQGIAAAADLDQASLIREAMQRIAQLNPARCAGLVFHQHDVSNPRTGSRLRILSTDVQSSWGLLPDFVICDELCHWELPDFWHSLLSSVAKRPQGLLAVLTNAGVGRGWQWDVREAARTSEQWYFSSLDGSQAPWISAENLAEQRQLLPNSVYERLWENRWQEAGGDFVTQAEAAACCDQQLSPRERCERGVRYVAAIDYAEKHDYTAAALVHREGPRIIVDRLDVQCPAPGAPVPASWVADWIARTATRFPNTLFVLDEYQLLGIIQELEGRHDVRRFEFLSGRGNHALAVLLRKLIVHRELNWFPNCGEIPSTHGVDNLETELASLVLRQSASGRVRIDHIQDRVHHDDRAFAVGAACLYAIRETGGEEWMEVSERGF